MCVCVHYNLHSSIRSAGQLGKGVDEMKWMELEIDRKLTLKF